MKRHVHFWLYEAPCFHHEVVATWDATKAIVRAFQLFGQGKGVRAFYFEDTFNDGSITKSCTYYVGGEVEKLNNLDPAKLTKQDQEILNYYAKEAVYNRILSNKYTKGVSTLLTKDCVVFDEYLHINGGEVDASN